MLRHKFTKSPIRGQLHMNRKPYTPTDRSTWATIVQALHTRERRTNTPKLSELTGYWRPPLPVPSSACAAHSPSLWEKYRLRAHKEGTREDGKKADTWPVEARCPCYQTRMNRPETLVLLWKTSELVWMWDEVRPLEQQEALKKQPRDIVETRNHDKRSQAA